jgi:hypothetical protein
MTAQFHEHLILDGETTSMACCPPLPKKHPRIIDRHAQGLPGDDEDVGCYSTACWREYIGTWEIKDGKFYLRRLVGCYRFRDEEPIFADWVSGTLRIPMGERLQYVHMGFGSVYEKDLLIKLEKGIVVSREELDHRGEKFERGSAGMLNLPGLVDDFVDDSD